MCWEWWGEHSHAQTGAVGSRVTLCLEMVLTAKHRDFLSTPSPGGLDPPSQSLVFSVPLTEGNDLPDVPLSSDLPAPTSAPLPRTPSPNPTLET